MLFGKKKKEELIIPEHQETEIKLPTLEEIKQQIEDKPIREELKPEEIEWEKTEEIEVQPRPKVEKKVFEERPKIIFRKNVPVFIKIEKYEEILNNIQELKHIIALIRSSLSIFEESEKVKSETIELVKENMENFESKIDSLKSALLAEGTREEKIAEIQHKDEMKEVLSNLKAQIDKLREEIQSMG